MDYDVSVSERKTYVHIRVKAPVTDELLEEFLRLSAEEAKESGLNKFLFDLRLAPNRATMFRHYQFVYERSRELGFRSGSKHALVVSAEDLGEYSFVETVLINAGYQGKMFTDELSAIEWLEK